MPTARYLTEAISVPQLGILVVGGFNHKGILNTAEVLDCEIETWRVIDQMILPRGFPRGVYFRESVFIAGDLNTMNHTIERLTVSPHLPLQWTLLKSAIPIKSNIVSLCHFKNEIFISCKIYFLLLY